MIQDKKELLNVIIIDDDEQNLYLLEVMLKNEKFNVTSAHNGGEALQLLKKEKFNLIISDILMPVMDGFQLCRECKTDPSLKNIPFVFYTATYTNDNDREFALGLGADRFIIKPADPSDFMKLIKEVIFQYKKGDIEVKNAKIADDKEYLMEHNRRLAGKLDNKIVMLEKTNEELSKQKDIIRNYLDVVGVIILILDKNGNIKLINKKGCEIIGQNEKELLDKNWFDNFVPEEYREAMIKTHKANISNKIFYEFIENAILAKDNKIRIIAWYKNLLKDDKNEIYGVLCSGEDITERKQMEDSLRKREEKYRTLVDNMQDAVYRCDLDGNIIFTTPSAARMLGCSSAESMIGMNIARDFYYYPEDGQRLFKAINESGRLTQYEVTLKRKDNEKPVIVLMNSQFYRDKYGNIVGIEGVYNDITKRKMAEKKIEEFANLHQTILDTVSVGLIYVKDRITQWTNNTWAKMFGYENSEIIGKETLIYYKDEEEYKKIGREGYSVLAKGETYCTELYGKRKDGSTFLCHLIGKAINPKNISEGSIWMAQDITEQKKSEEKIKQSLFERETLIRELYHRTKNTMQVIRGMLILQAEDYPKNKDLQNVIKNTENRIHAISLVHQMLYKSQDLSHISIKEYIFELSSLILKSFGISTNRISLDIKADDQYFLIDTAIPVGLILDELLTNSLKYAFPDNSKGIISITLTRKKTDKNILLYFDNGIGVPKGFNFRKQNTLGLKLIYSIGEHQLKGKIVMKNNNGVYCKLEFSNNLYKSRV